MTEFLATSTAPIVSFVLYLATPVGTLKIAVAKAQHLFEISMIVEPAQKDLSMVHMLLSLYGSS